MANRRSMGPLGAPLAAVYGLGVVLRRWGFDRGWLPVTPSPSFTISVGGLEAGGTGKTPVAALLLGALERAGRRPGLLTRGYGRQTRGLVVRPAGGPVEPGAIGDEPAMIVGSLDVPVAACAERRLGAEALAGVGCDVLVMDDGFAHRYLARDVDIVVLRGEAPLGSGHLLPWGTLREPLSSLGRAQVLWFHHRSPDSTADDVPSWVLRVAPDATIVTSRAVPGALVEAVGDRGSPPTRAVAAAGIARPEELRGTLHAQGVDVAELVPFRDHHLYGSADVDRLLEAGRRGRAEAVVVTAKDAVKLASLWPANAPLPLWISTIRVEVVGGQDGVGRLLGLPPGWAESR